MTPGRWYFVWGPRNTEIYDPNNKLWANLQKPKAITDVVFQDRVKALCDLLNSDHPTQFQMINAVPWDGKGESDA